MFLFDLFDIVSIMNVVIVESGAKAKTIQKHLESLFPERSFQVIACFGHIRDLPEKEMGVDTNNWTVKYVDTDKKKVLPRLKQAVKDASMVYLAPDPDREGEAIAYHLKECLRLKPKTYKRVTFHEITKDAIGRAFAQPRDIDMPLVDAQETRRILDRVVGYELSPLLWRRYCTSNLSAGRVQSTALQMIVERAKDAEKHIAEVFWTIGANFGNLQHNWKSSLYYEKEEARWEDMEEAKKMFEYVLQCNQKQKDGWSIEITKRVSKKSPSPPFITTTLQKEAYELYKIPSKQVMSLAQKLYEGGYITYMRTDSPAISDIARAETLGYIRENVGTPFAQERRYESKNSHSQEAHECIRPSHVEMTSEQLSYNEELTALHIKLYDLIWRRTVASQMVDAEYDEFDYVIRHKKMAKAYAFCGTARVLVKPGYLKVYSPKTKVDASEQTFWTQIMGNMESSQPIVVSMQELSCHGDATRGQGLYHEPSIIKAMEKAGIGRPSTYASILEKLFTKKYVVHGTNPQCDIEVEDRTWKSGEDISIEKRKIHLGGNDKDRLVPTTLGYRVVEYLAEAYPALLDIQFTSRMEEELDEISRGQRNKTYALGNFYGDFHKCIQNQLTLMKENVATKNDTETKSKRDTKSKACGSGSEGKTTHNMKVLRAWEKLHCDAVETKYGMALYDVKKKTFLSITPFLEWKGKTLEEVSDDNVRFLKSFPRKINGSTRIIELGPYGLYVKDGKKNIPFPKELWATVEDGSITAEQLNQLSWKTSKRSFGSREAPE